MRKESCWAANPDPKVLAFSWTGHGEDDSTKTNQRMVFPPTFSAF